MLLQPSKDQTCSKRPGVVAGDHQCSEKPTGSGIHWDQHELDTLGILWSIHQQNDRLGEETENVDIAHGRNCKARRQLKDVSSTSPNWLSLPCHCEHDFVLLIATKLVHDYEGEW